MKKAKLTILVSVVVLGLVASGVSWADPMGTAFTYQGRLTDEGGPANGSYDFKFELYDDPSGGSQVGDTISVDDHEVADGLFTVQLDFGSDAFDGAARWLEVARGEEFSPVKNATGVDSPATARDHMSKRAAAWIEACGVTVPRKPDGSPDGVFEISPLLALDAEHLGEVWSPPESIASGASFYLPGPDK